MNFSINRKSTPLKISAIVFIYIILISPVTFSLADENKDHICFSALDSNKDGFVTFEEFEQAYDKDKEKFNMADGDKDGKLTHDEYHDLLGHGAS